MSAAELADEQPILEAHRRGDLEEAARAGLDRYKIEVYSFLCARLGSESDAHEVFAQASEDVWRGIATFSWRCSFRTWFYILARHAAVRFERSPANQSGRWTSLSRAADLPADARTPTRPYLRTDVKDRFAALRATLTPDEQTLLVLRVDRELSWEDAARVLSDDTADLTGDPDDETLRRRSAALRQRFQKLKERLRDAARAAGLLDDDTQADGSRPPPSARRRSS